jgi:hypothetical protein
MIGYIREEGGRSSVDRQFEREGAQQRSGLSQLDRRVGEVKAMAWNPTTLYI